jgi:hypothetical protein
VTLVAIELNDAGILSVTEGGDVSLPSPGFALIEGGELAVGRSAASRARLVPKRVHTRYWEKLDTEPLRRPFPSHLSSADLVHAHLERIWSEVGEGADRSILAVPGAYSEHQLGLLLGIARACRIPVTGMVDAAVVGAVDHTDVPMVLHLDIQLHSAVVTAAHLGAELVRYRVEVTDRTGLVQLNAAWAAAVASEFLRKTRFDPLHLAVTEQTLYDRLPRWLRELRREGTATVTLEAGGRSHTVDLALDSLTVAARPHSAHLLELVRAVAAGADHATLVMSHRAAQLPGLEAELARLPGIEVTALPIAAAAVGAIRHAAEIESSAEALPFVTRLQVAAGEDAIARPSGGHDSPREGSVPTHLLHDGAAHPITSEPFFIGAAIPDDSHGLELTGATAGISRCHCSISKRGERVVVEDHSSYGSFVNDCRIDGSAELVTGDRLRLGTPGIELELIEVVD